MSEKMKVLIADDNRDFCDVIKNYLEKQPDMEIIDIALDGEEAFEKIVSEKPDIALIDGIMPRLDGIGVLEKLSKLDKPVDTMCIMLTAITQEQVTLKAFSLGAKYYIAKPF
ncbi:MAG: response regulator, partial [Firmicutes bacterium]|nr:response regulator [Bacillota bacterium]